VELGYGFLGCVTTSHFEKSHLTEEISHPALVEIIKNIKI
jgi:hypothetical protein